MNKQKQRITIAEDQAARFHDEIARRQEVARTNKALDLKERDQLRAENATLRAAQKACEACDEPTAFEVRQLRAEVERLSALGSWAHTCIHHNDERRAKAKGCPVCATAECDHWQKIAVSASQEREHNANVAQAMTAERDQLRAALALGQINCDAQYDDLRTERNQAIIRAERAEAELATERARLDWLALSWDNPLAINLHPSYGWSAASKNLRASIDAAMKDDAK